MQWVPGSFLLLYFIYTYNRYFILFFEFPFWFDKSGFFHEKQFSLFYKIEKTSWDYFFKNKSKVENILYIIYKNESYMYFSVLFNINFNKNLF